VIRVNIQRDDTDGSIQEFTLSGHAEFAESGKDLVCAAVSGISFGAINAIDALLNIQLTIKTNEKDGFLHCTVPRSLETAVYEKVQLLLEGMIVALQSIASEYGAYITINDRR
jgi:uncharacterized protein YsxB (DUF464 family)